MFNMAGMQLPEYLKGRNVNEEEEVIEKEVTSETKKKEKED